MNEIILDFSGIKSLWTLHEYFKEIFQLPEYYGRNMDALWDCLLYYYDEPTTIILKHLEKIPSEMSEAVETMLALFMELQKEDENITIQIEEEYICDISSYQI